MQQNLYAENGKRQERLRTSSTFAEAVGAKKKFVHAVNVGWGTGYAKNVMVDTLWT